MDIETPNANEISSGCLNRESSDYLGTTSSSERFKAEIEPMDKASEAIFALKPVTFRYKQELDLAVCAAI